jgi:hypothetical protein
MGSAGILMRILDVSPSSLLQLQEVQEIISFQTRRGHSTIPAAVCKCRMCREVDYFFLKTYYSTSPASS